MCGIHGFARLRATSKGTDETLGGMIEDSIITGSLRGDDSIGYFNLFGGKDGILASYERVPVSGLHLHSTIQKDWRKTADNSRAFVLHHRAATAGRISVAAAHPHYHEVDGKRIIGVHNGTLRSWYQSDNGKTFASDSSYLMHEILTKGAEQALRNVNGSYAVVYRLSEQPHKLFFARNYERPMEYMWSEDKEVMLFGSEVSMLHWLYGRQNSWNNSKTASINTTIHTLPTEQLWCLDVETMQFEQVGDLKKPTPVYTPTPKATTTTPTTSFPPAATNANPPYKHPTVSKEEDTEARKLAVLGDIVEFVPHKRKHDKHGVLRFISGFAQMDNGDQYEARFRGLPKALLDSEEVMGLDWVWRATVVGVGQLGREKVDYLILSDLVEININQSADLPIDDDVPGDDEEESVAS